MPDEQVFDKPVEAFLTDNNVLKWLSSRDQAQPALESIAEATTASDKHEVLNAIKSALASWDPNQGPEHEERIRSQLEATLSEISEQTLKRLTESQRESVRAQQKNDMGYAYVFVASPNELSLTKDQQAELAELSKRATDEAATAARHEMDQIQIRNPQAYLAYKLSKLYEQIRKRRLVHGREFYDKSLGGEQRSRLKLSQPSQ